MGRIARREAYRAESRPACQESQGNRSQGQSGVTRIFLSAILGCVAPAWCWGPVGHHIVAIIAEQRLSPQARVKVHKLLLDGKYSMIDISTCADQIRGSPRGTPTP